MKEEFGASMVRPYAVSCRDVNVWENLVRACVENQMGLIAQVWWGFDEDMSRSPVLLVRAPQAEATQFSKHSGKRRNLPSTSSLRSQSTPK